MPEDDFHFGGFTNPNYTTVPDEVFDILLPHITDPELRVLLYIIRRTFGFKKTSDDISLRQMVEGITTVKDGRVLDSGAGLSKASAARGLKGLAEKGIITATRNRSVERGNEPTTYRLRFREDTLSQTETRVGSILRQALVSNRDTQETVEQETVEQDLVEISTNTRRGKFVFDADRGTIQRYIEDLARELNDSASLKASTTRATKLYRASGLDLDTFIDAMQEARRRTQEHSASIRATDGNGPRARKQKFGYFMAVLDDIVGQSLDTSESVAD